MITKPFITSKIAARPNPSVNPTRYGTQRKPGPREIGGQSRIFIPLSDSAARCRVFLEDENRVRVDFWKTGVIADLSWFSPIPPRVAESSWKTTLPPVFDSIAIPLLNMRRKVIQHFANMFPQKFLDLPEGHDLAILAKEKSGVVEFDFLQGTALIAGVSRPEFRTSTNFRAWLVRESEAHGIPFESLLQASMRVAFEVTGIEVKESFGHVSRSATFSFVCESDLRTDERSYVCRSSGSKAWGYHHYWEKLFGAGEG